MTSLWKLCAAMAVAAVVGFAPSVRAEVRVQGAGATFPAPLYAKWVEEYGKLHPDVKIDYGAEGSGAGIKKITDGVVNFGASDAPLNDAQTKALPKDKGNLLHIPTVAGQEVMVFNLPGVDKLRLNGAVIGDVYLKKIRTWNDPAIAAINPGVALPNTPILVVHRSDGSGTSYIFTDYLSKVSKQWNDDIGASTAPDWPVGIGGAKNDGVTAAVKNSAGALGYVEYAYAVKNNLPFAIQINKDGKEVAPTIANVLAASSASLKSFPADMKVSITDAPGADSYPICGYTYILIYDDTSYMTDKATALATLEFIKWCETDGQEMAESLGYAKLPKEAQSKVIEKLMTVKYKGEALLK